MMHTFQASFGRLTCTITFDAAVDFDGVTGYPPITKHWSPQPTEKEFAQCFPQYRAWIHTVNAQLATLIKGPYRTVIHDRRGHPPRWEAWVYYPGGKAECVQKGGGVPPGRT